MNKPQLYLIVCLALGLHFSGSLNPALSQNANPKILAQLPKPPIAGIPDGRKPAGTRGSCEDTALPFTPVLPNPNPDFSGLTLNTHPTFWFYVPYQSNRVQAGRFSLETEEGGLSIWRSDFQLPQTPGFVSVVLPKTVKGLEEGKIYKWYFTIYCSTGRNNKLDEENEPSFVFHKGLIKRAKKSDFNTAANGNSSNLPLSFYLEGKIWYDAANKMAEIRKSPRLWNVFLERMNMSAWKEEKVAGALYGSSPEHLSVPALSSRDLGDIDR